MSKIASLLVFLVAGANALAFLLGIPIAADILVNGFHYPVAETSALLFALNTILLAPLFAAAAYIHDLDFIFLS